MILTPYKRPPKPPTVAVLLEDGTRALDEHGEVLELGLVPSGTHVYASHEQVEELFDAGVGEVLAWNDNVTRWRLNAGGDPPGVWKPRPSDARVLYQEFPVRPDEALKGLVGWRDWLASYSAAPTSMGGASLSLLRASLERPLWTNVGERPPLRWTLGGRIQRAVEPGHYQARLAHVDLPAAYGRTLGALSYGGRWMHFPAEKLTFFERLRLIDPTLPAFVRARVTVPELAFGPLPRRPRRVPGGWGSALRLEVDFSYPTGRRLTSLWTVQELAQADAHGCRIVPLEGWLHFPPHGEGDDRFWKPFAPWWQRVEAQRQATAGFEQRLVKQTGNSLWGMFAMNEKRRVIVWRDKRGRRHRREAPPPGGRRPAHDLAETVCGRVRAQLYELMMEAGREHTLCVHTDGGWFLEDGWQPLEGWAVKERAAELRLLMPSIHAFRRPRYRRWEYRVAGVRRDRQQHVFETWWQRGIGRVR